MQQGGLGWDGTARDPPPQETVSIQSQCSGSVQSGVLLPLRVQEGLALEEQTHPALSGMVPSSSPHRVGEQAVPYIIPPPGRSG